MAIDKRKNLQGKTTYRARLRTLVHGDMSKTFDRLADARDWEAKTRLSSKVNAGPTEEAQGRTVSDAIDRYLELLPSRGLKDVRNRRRHLEWWRGKLGPMRLSELTQVQIATQRDHLLATAIGPAQFGVPPRLRSPATVVRYLASLSHVLTTAADDWGWLPDNPVRKVRKPRQPRGRVRYLSDGERERLLTACRSSKSEALYPVVVIAITTGMRRGEILSLRWGQVDLERGTFSLEHTKNGDRRQLPLVGHAKSTLTAWAKQPHDATDYVFPGEAAGCARDISKAWRTAVAKAGIVNFRFHDLRHTTASYLAMRSASLLEIGEVLGHKSPQMTQRYAHISLVHTTSVLAAMVDSIFPAAGTPILSGDASSAGLG